MSMAGVPCASQCVKLTDGMWNENENSLLATAVEPFQFVLYDIDFNLFPLPSARDGPKQFKVSDH